MRVSVYSVSLGCRTMQHQWVRRVPWKQQEKPVSALSPSLAPPALDLLPPWFSLDSGSAAPVTLFDVPWASLLR